jgi:hypothetical protein
LDDSNKLQLFPPGWTGFGGHEEPAVFFAVNSEMGPQRQSVSRFAGIGSFYNAGLPDDPDRALVTVVRAAANGKLDGNEIELLTRITDADAKGLRLQFDIEAWNAFSRLVTESGEAAFDVKVEIDAGSGYESLVDLGRQSTGRVLLLPEARDAMINGNDAANRTTVDLVAPDVAIPAGAKMRIRFITAEDETAGTGGWFFGLDNLSLQLSPQPGDASGDRSVDFDDFVRLANHFAMPGTWGDGDFDLDGIVAFPDFVILAQNFQALGEDTAITSVPEPSCASMMLIAASIIPVMVSRRNIVFFIAWSEPTSPGRAASN